MLKGNTRNSMREDLGVEVEYETERERGNLQIGEDLCFMNGYHLFDALYLNDDCLVDDEIRPVDSVNGMTLIYDRNRRLASHRETKSLKFNVQTFLVNGFEQPWSKLSVDFDRSANDTPGKIIC